VSSSCRLRIGDKVVLTADFARFDDASSGPLKSGEVGEILEDDHDSKPFKVRAHGTDWYYAEGALRRALTPALASGHPGEWRSGRPAKTQWCSLSGRPEGLICEHGGNILTTPHWSCCGTTTESSACSSVAAVVRAEPTSRSHPGCAALRKVQHGDNTCETCRGRYKTCHNSYGHRNGGGKNWWADGACPADLSHSPESPNARWCTAACEAMSLGSPQRPSEVLHMRIH
jgi:hypothetical protein